MAGRVVDDGGVGIARAQLRLNEEDQAVAWAISDGSGRFEFEVDVAAVVSVEAVAPGYGRAWTPSLAPNHALEVRMPPASTIAGVVVDEGGAAIAGALVETEIGLEAILAGRFAPERDWTDSNGRFEITGLAPGDYRLRADGRLGRSDRVDLSLGLAEARTDLRLVARTGNLLQVTLHDHHDQPCRAGQVRLGASGRAGVTEGGGRWVFADVGRGRYDLVAHCEGSALLRESVWVEGDTELALRSPRGAAVSGTVRRSDGTPVRAYVHAVGTDNHVGVRSDADGRFTLTGLVAERVRLDVSALGVLVERRAEFDLVANEDRRDVELIAATGECVTGRLDGPAPDSVVIAARVGDRTVDVATADSEGRFRLCGIGLGETVVVELASGGGACRVEKTQPGPGRGDEGGWICEP